MENKKISHSHKTILPIFFFFLLFSISFISATTENLGTFQQRHDIVLKQLCGNCTYNNITSITYPNSTSVFSYPVVMSRFGSDYSYNLTNNYTNPIGIYNVNGIGDLDGESTAWSYTFEVTPSGYNFLNTLWFHIFIIAVSFGLFIVAVCIKDAPLAILGSLGMYFVGLYTLFYGFAGLTDGVYSKSFSILLLGVAFYISTKSSQEFLESNDIGV